MSGGPAPAPHIRHPGGAWRPGCRGPSTGPRQPGDHVTPGGQYAGRTMISDSSLSALFHSSWMLVPVAGTLTLLYGFAASQ